MSKTEEILERIDVLREQKGFSDRELSILATGKPDAMRDMRRRGARPSRERLEAFAAALGTTSDWLLGANNLAAIAGPNAVLASARIDYRPLQGNFDVPVLGTAEGATLDFRDDGQIVSVVSIDVTMDDPLDFLRRPPSIPKGRYVYALHIVGWSMHPRFDEGDPVIVDPHRPAVIGDDVVIQLKGPDPTYGERVVRALVKTLRRKTPDFIEVEQYNPPATFRIPLADVHQLHRVMPRRELSIF